MLKVAVVGDIFYLVAAGQIWLTTQPADAKASSNVHTKGRHQDLFE